MEIEHKGKRISLSGDDLVIGSDPGVGLVLEGLEPRHAAIRKLGERMATIMALSDQANLLVNGVASKREAMPLLHGDVVKVGEHELRVINPAHPSGSPGTPPVGGRERLHDTLFGIPRRPSTRKPDGGKGPATSERARVDSDVHFGVVIAGFLSLTTLLVMLFR
jgi:hypothetical protein